jgi:hypothetical protein
VASNFEVFETDIVEIKFLTHTLRKWETTLNTVNGEESVTSKEIKIKWKIFQGDVVIHMALNLLNHVLNSTDYGFIIIIIIIILSSVRPLEAC